jgi:hypothetical protein
MVRGSLSFASYLNGKNVVKWAVIKIKEREIEEVYDQLDRISWIEDTLASSFIRDVVDVFDVELRLSLNDFCLLNLSILG